MKTIGHHTCKQDGGEAYVLEMAPFLSEYIPQKGKKPFLGEGYYFWDYDIEQAKKWGEDHYNNNYYVLQCDLEVSDDLYMDLAGNRLHMEYFLQLLDRFAKKGVDAKKWQLGEFIEFLKRVRMWNHEVFPFEVIRAEDYLPSNKNYAYFFNHLKNYTNLSPRFVICFFSIREVFLQKKELVYKS